MSRFPLACRFLIIAAIALIGWFLLTESRFEFSPRVRAESLAQPHQQTLTSRVYIPLVMHNYCGNQKCWSGVHLGNRTSDWNTTFLHRIDPALGGKWPQAVVVLSNQVYQIHRYPSTDPNYPCRIYGASPSPDRSVIFDYLKRAAQAGVRVIIRIYPSPGNFEDWDDPSWSNHHLSAGPPVGPDGYCRPDLYRSAGDLGDEMGVIHNLNVTYGFSEFGFEPANEPNLEWYSTQKGSVRIFQSTAWAEMDAYFSAVYDYVHTYYPSVRVLTPPMAQGLYAEGIDIADVFQAPYCEERRLDNQQTGYDVMFNFYSSKNDGIDWHNYWILDKEVYDFCPNGQHVSLYFPTWMWDAIRTGQKPTTVTEADLASPQQGMGNPLSDKQSGSNPSLAAESIRHFFSSEWEFGSYNFGMNPIIASWLLTDNTGNAEHDWHKAYEEDGTEREWFRLWYLGQESWP